MTKRLVLVGAGHAHAQVLKTWADTPLPGVEVVVVSPHALAPYSGMVPGWLAGRYRFDDIVIDFETLCAQAGARWVPAALSRLQPDQRVIRLDSGEQVAYDLLSLNLGSTLVPPASEHATQLLPMRPLADLRTRYDALLTRWRTENSADPMRVVAVGGGAAGFESLLAVLQRLRTLRRDRKVSGVLFSHNPQLLPGHPAATQQTAMRLLQQAGIELKLGTAWSDSESRRGDLVLWATGAQAHDWQRNPDQRGTLAVSPDGFVRVDEQLRSVSHPHIFAVGDCAHWGPRSLPKAGVYAVRMGPVLLHNLQAVLRGTALKPYRPQTRFLSLLATTGGRAIASRGSWSGSGHWAWWLKHHIDRGFIRRFSPATSGAIHFKGESP